MVVCGDEIRRVMGRFATGVTVVTILDDNNIPQGFTVNSLTSVSLDPPLALVCVDLSAKVYPSFQRDRVFAVNILSEDQEEISRRFASKIDDKFQGISCRPGKSGPPLIDGCIGYMECRIVHDYPGGDHTIFVGLVEITESNEGGKPLLFYGGKYAKL